LTVILVLSLVSFGMNDVSAQFFFNSLKSSNSVRVLKIMNAKFYTEGFKQLAEYIKITKTLVEMRLENLDYLGIKV